MSLVSEYQRQFAWRDWPTIFGALPALSGQRVLDLGCGVGDQAAELVARGAYVIGIDANEELLREARSRRLVDAEFRHADLRKFALDDPVDGLWCSFTAAYFPDFGAVLDNWKRQLRPGGWIALTEIDDLFAHEPLSEQVRSLFDAYERDALAAERYDFHMGRKLRSHLERVGFAVSRALTLGDRELSFQGPADPEVVDAWRARLDRMRLLRELCGTEFESLREAFLGCLAHAGHSSGAKVYFVLAALRP